MPHRVFPRMAGAAGFGGKRIPAPQPSPGDQKQQGHPPLSVIVRKARDRTRPTRRPDPLLCGSTPMHRGETKPRVGISFLGPPNSPRQRQQRKTNDMPEPLASAEECASISSRQSMPNRKRIIRSEVQPVTRSKNRSLFLLDFSLPSQPPQHIHQPFQVVGCRERVHDRDSQCA